MVDLWYKVIDLLEGDVCITGYVDPITTGGDSGIRRGEQPELGGFTNCICVRQPLEVPNLGIRRGKRIKPPIYDVTMLISVFVVEGQGDMPADVKCALIAQCVKERIEGCELNDWCNDRSILIYDKGFDGMQTGVYYDRATQARRSDMRFVFTVGRCSFRTPLPMCQEE